MSGVRVNNPIRRTTNAIPHPYMLPLHDTEVNSKRVKCRPTCTCTCSIVECRPVLVCTCKYPQYGNVNVKVYIK